MRIFLYFHISNTHHVSGLGAGRPDTHTRASRGCVPRVSRGRRGKRLEGGQVGSQGPCSGVKGVVCVLRRISIRGRHWHLLCCTLETR